VAEAAPGPPTVLVVPAPGERSPAHARNVGAGRASRDWILFLDADCTPQAGLLEAYFTQPVADDVGALAGELIPAPGGRTLTSRYGAARNFLGQKAHLSHAYLPRAAAANLLVRRDAFEQVGGFYEGLRAAEDTDFAWRLQRAGWRLEPCAEARVEHVYRAALGELRRQWRGYAAGRAWLSRRYEGFSPEPAVVRGLGRARRHIRLSRTDGVNGSSERAPRERGSYLALDALLALEELAGFALSNRPADPRLPGTSPVDVVLVADRFPGRGDPLVELAQAVGRARIEAAGRPDVPDQNASRLLDVRYLEDDGAGARAAAALALAVRHPLRVASDLLSPDSTRLSTWALAPAVLRLARDSGARVHPLGGEAARGTARRIARLAGRQLEE
jgi:Glycosyl transferase family group 2